MLLSQTMRNMIAACNHAEEVMDLCGRATYDRYYPSAFITTGLATDGEAIRSLKINHWTGNQLVGENLIEEQVVVTFVSQIDKAHKTSQTPWLNVQPIGAIDDTPNGLFA